MLDNMFSLFLYIHSFEKSNYKFIENSTNRQEFLNLKNMVFL